MAEFLWLVREKVFGIQEILQTIPNRVIFKICIEEKNPW